jgi:cytochrome c-type biogenesis protein CcmF
MLSVDGFEVGGFAGLALGIWVILWSIHSILDRLKNQTDKFTGLRKIPASIWGMSVAHFGLGIFVIGVAHVNTYSLEKDIRLQPGETYEMAGYEFTFNGVTKVTGENYVADQGNFIVSTRSGDMFKLEPQKRFYSSGNPMTEAAINTTLGRDVYVSLGENLNQGAWSVRLYLKSFVACIWLGGLIMALGGLIATADKRYRRPVKKMTKQQIADVNAA